MKEQGRSPDGVGSLLRVRGLQVRIGAGEGAVRPVDGLDFDIRPGETFALLGESGCGKSMTALSVMRLLPPGAAVLGGEVWLDGTELLALPESAMRRERGVCLDVDRLWSIGEEADRPFPRHVGCRDGSMVRKRDGQGAAAGR